MGDSREEKATRDNTVLVGYISDFIDMAEDYWKAKEHLKTYCKERMKSFSEEVFECLHMDVCYQRAKAGKLLSLGTYLYLDDPEGFAYVSYDTYKKLADVGKELFKEDALVSTTDTVKALAYLADGEVISLLKKKMEDHNIRKTIDLLEMKGVM